MSDTDYERQVFDHIQQWRAYLHALDSPRLRPTPSFLDIQPPNAALDDETRCILHYEQQIYQKKHGLGRWAAGGAASG